MENNIEINAPNTNTDENSNLNNFATSQNYNHYDNEIRLNTAQNENVDYQPPPEQFSSQYNYENTAHQIQEVNQIHAFETNLTTVNEQPLYDSSAQ